MQLIFAAHLLLYYCLELKLVHHSLWLLKRFSMGSNYPNLSALLLDVTFLGNTTLPISVG